MTRDYIVCLEDGKRFKTLKRHLAVHYNMTPQEYRERWNLPADYPMAAPSYSESRSALAKALGLGKKRQAVATQAGNKKGATKSRTTPTPGSPRRKRARLQR